MSQNKSLFADKILDQLKKRKFSEFFVRIKKRSIIKRGLLIKKKIGKKKNLNCQKSLFDKNKSVKVLVGKKY